MDGGRRFHLHRNVFGGLQGGQQARQPVVEGLFGDGRVERIESGAADEFVGDDLHPGASQVFQAQAVDGRAPQDDSFPVQVQHGQQGAVQAEIEVQQGLGGGAGRQRRQGQRYEALQGHREGGHDAGQQFQLLPAVDSRHRHQQRLMGRGQALPDAGQVGVGQVGVAPAGKGRVLQGIGSQMVPELVVDLAGCAPAVFLGRDPHLEAAFLDKGLSRAGQGSRLEFHQSAVRSGRQEARVVEFQSDHAASSDRRVCSRRVSRSSQ